MKLLAIAACASLLLSVSAAPTFAQAFDTSELDKLLKAPIEQPESAPKPLEQAPIEAKPSEQPAAADEMPPLAPQAAAPPRQTAGTDGWPTLSGLVNFHVVAPGILRGGQPTPADLLSLKKAGVKTVINLRNEPVLVKQEAQVAKSLGLSFINIPLDVFNPPPEAFVNSFLKLVSDAANQPVYIHCLHGQDRTGTMVALYRIERQGWSADQAYSEMLACGFRPGFANLSKSVFAHGAAAGRPGTAPTGDDIISDLRKRLHR